MKKVFIVCLTMLALCACSGKQKMYSGEMAETLRNKTAELIEVAGNAALEASGQYKQILRQVNDGEASVSDSLKPLKDVQSTLQDAYSTFYNLTVPEQLTESKEKAADEINARLANVSVDVRALERGSKASAELSYKYYFSDSSLSTSLSAFLRDVEEYDISNGWPKNERA